MDNNIHNINRLILDQFIIQKPFNITVIKEFNAETQFLSVNQQAKLAELFFSPAIKCFNTGATNEYMNGYPIIITNKSVNVRSRYPKDSFIQYTITFELANKFYTQKY